MKARKSSLIGHTIIDVQFHSFDDGRGGATDDPTLVLDNGRRVDFMVRETEVGRYGVEIEITPMPKGVDRKRGDAVTRALKTGFTAGVRWAQSKMR
jgi:hypothetical protein